MTGGRGARNARLFEGVNGIRVQMIDQSTTASSGGRGAYRAHPALRYDVVLSNTPPDAFSFLASSAYSDSI
jgi:hypothetical protein